MKKIEHISDLIEKTSYLDFSNIKILVIGDCMLDIYHYGTVDRVSPEAPVLVFKANNSEPEYRLGGACNTALNLAKLGVETNLIGFVGKDLNETYVKSYLLEYKINYRLFALPNFPTITKNRYFVKNQQVFRIDQEDTNPEIYNDYMYKELVELTLSTMVNYDAIIFSDYGKGALTSHVLNAILSYCHEDIPIFIDPKLNDWGHYKNAFCITPNWEEFIKSIDNPKLKRTKDPNEIAKYAGDQCRKHNIDYVLITLGSQGMILIDKNNQWQSTSAKAKEVYDVSGAGDTVIATLAAAYCKDYPMKICMQLATMAAKVVVGKVGTYAITDDELKLELLNLHFGKEC